jgi:hypothetical protein
MPISITVGIEKTFFEFFLQWDRKNLIEFSKLFKSCQIYIPVPDGIIVPYIHFVRR